jgi:uncharacterized protein
LEKLLDKDADIECVDDQDATPLLLACLADRKDTVRALLIRGANPDHAAEKSNLCRAIHVAARNGSPTVVALLLEFGASENAQLDSELKLATPLHLASQFSDGSEGFAQVARTLLRVGTDVDAKNEDGATPLHLAIMEDEDEKIVQVLVDFGANVDILDEDGHSPVYYAVKNDSKFTNILWKSGSGSIERAKKQTILFHAAANGNVDRINQLIAAEYNISERDAFGRTAYDIATGEETRKARLKCR